MKTFWDHLWRPPEAYRLTTLVFLKGLGLVYAVALHRWLCKSTAWPEASASCR